MNEALMSVLRMRRIQHGESDIKLDINLLSREKFVNWMVT
jgi:hypothetical protein